MIRLRGISFIICILSCFLSASSQHESCNEIVCASIVSKCLLTKACKCDLVNCTCCKECSRCLDKLWTECCSCIEMCKPSTAKYNVSKQSTIEDLLNPIPSLFQSLVGEPDSLDRWFTLTFPVDFNTNAFKPDMKKEITYHTQTSEQEVFPANPGTVTFNCSVAYMSECMPLSKCKVACETMGANSYRWFHDGCCECVGNTCRDYGVNVSRCPMCPLRDVVMPHNAAELDYGEEDESL